MFSHFLSSFFYDAAQLITPILYLIKCIKNLDNTIYYHLSMFFLHNREMAGQSMNSLCGLKKMEKKFSKKQITAVNNSVTMAEELVSNYYKLSAAQWLRQKYDVKTVADLAPKEIVKGPFAQIVRYKGQRRDTALGSATYDFYKICLQDHAIIDTLKKFNALRIFPFTLYIITHELIHIVRFSKFLQNFSASSAEKMAEEIRVHKKTNKILQPVQVPGLTSTLDFFVNWHSSLDDLAGN